MEKLNKPNQLIAVKSNQKITVLQRKSYNILLKNAQNYIKFNDIEVSKDSSYNFVIDCDTVHEVAGIRKKDLDYIHKELEGLMGVIATVRDKDNKNNWTKFSLLPKIEKRDGKYYYMLIGDIVKELKTQTFFTPTNLLMIKTLTSQYSITFYELAIRYEKFKIPKMSIEEVRELTGTINEYSRIEALKRRVLDVACKEISEKTDIKLTYTTEKKGRIITFIDFTIEKKEKDNKKRNIEKEIEKKIKEQKKKLNENTYVEPEEEKTDLENLTEAEKHYLKRAKLVVEGQK